MSEQHGQADGASPRRALLLDNDLFFAVKVADTLKHSGFTTRTVRRLGDFARSLEDEPPIIALVNSAARDVDWQAAIRQARQSGVAIIAYGSHVDLDTQELARQAGATSVIPNSKLATDLLGVVARALHRSSKASGVSESAPPSASEDV